MGLKYKDAVKVLRETVPGAFRMLVPTESDTSFTAVVVDLNSVMYSVMNRCKTGNDLKRRLREMILQHAELGAAVSVFCIDDKNHVPAAKNIEWARREKQSESIEPYSESVTLFEPVVVLTGENDENGKPLYTTQSELAPQDYRFSVDNALPDSYDRLRKTPELFRRFVAFVSQLFTKEINLLEMAQKYSYLTDYRVIICGMPCAVDNSACAHTGMVVHNLESVRTPISLKNVVRDIELETDYGWSDDEDAAKKQGDTTASCEDGEEMSSELSTDTTSRSERQKQVEKQFTPNAFPYVQIGEAECKAVHWAIEKLCLKGRHANVLIHANDSDALVAALLAAPRLVANKNSPRVHVALCQQYLLPTVHPQQQLDELKAEADNDASAAALVGRNVFLNKELAALQKDARCRDKVCDVVQLWAGINELEGGQPATECYENPVEMLVLALIMGGNDNVDPLPQFGGAKFWKSIHSRDTRRLLHNAFELVQCSGGWHHFRYNEDAWLEFLIGTALSANALKTAARNLFESEIGSFVENLDGLPLQMRYVIVSSAVSKCVAESKRVPHLPNYQLARAWLRRVMWSFDYYGNVNSICAARCDEFAATPSGLSAYGYTKDKSGRAQPAAVVAEIDQPFFDTQRVHVGEGGVVDLLSLISGKEDTPRELSLHALKRLVYQQIEADKAAKDREIQAMIANYKPPTAVAVPLIMHDDGDDDDDDEHDAADKKRGKKFRFLNFKRKAIEISTKQSEPTFNTDRAARKKRVLLQSHDYSLTMEKNHSRNAGVSHESDEWAGWIARRGVVKPLAVAAGGEK